MPKNFHFRQDFSSPQALWNFIHYLGRLEPDLGLKCQIDLVDKSVVLSWSREDASFAKKLEQYAQPDSSVTLFCDGGSRGNPGPGAAGFIILDASEKVIVQGGQFFKHCTNNFAEYQSLKQGLEAALKAQITDLKICMDSQLVVKQVKGEFKIKNQTLLPIYREILAYLQKLRRYEIVFVPRRYNTQADAIVNQVLDEHT